MWKDNASQALGLKNVFWYSLIPLIRLPGCICLLARKCSNSFPEVSSLEPEKQKVCTRTIAVLEVKKLIPKRLRRRRSTVNEKLRFSARLEVKYRNRPRTGKKIKHCIDKAVNGSANDQLGIQQQEMVHFCSYEWNVERLRREGRTYPWTLAAHKPEAVDDLLITNAISALARLWRRK